MTGLTFNSPFTQHLGIEITEWQENQVSVQVKVKEEFLNTHGVPHGGFLCSLLDVATALSGTYCPKDDRVRKALTLSLNTHFLSQASGDTLYATGKVIKSGYKIYYANAEISDSHQQVIATAQAVLKYTKGSENPDGVPE